MDTECPCCDETIEVDGDGDPYTYDDEKLCGDCYHDQYEFPCCACQEYGHVDDQHNFCVVFEPDECGTPPGIYRIISYPYFYSDMLSGGLFPHALHLMASLPFMWLAYRTITGQKIFYKMKAGDNPNGDSMGHLCADCQTKILGQISKRER